MKQRKWEHPGSISDRTLFVCQFEDIVKRSFFEYLKVLEIMLQDQIAHSRSTAMRLLSQLLNSKDEQANNMISMMANKLGDPDKKIASRVVYYLQELINSQPKAISKTVAYIEQVILRPGMKEKAQYYGVTFLSQIMLSHETPDITDQILKIYVALMKNTILPSLNFTSSKDNTKRKNKKVTKVKLGMATESDIEPATSRLAKIILVGFGRALPFCKHPEEFVNDLSNPIQTLMSHANFSTVMQALNLYFTMATTGSDIGLNEMFIKAVDKVLSRSEILTVTSSHPQLIATVFKIVSHPDLNIVASHAVIKSLFRLVFKVPSSAFVLAVLLLFLEVLKTKGSLKAMFNMPGDVIESNNLQEYTSSSLWELHALCSHQDAKIQGLAKTILKGELAIEGLSANPFENQSVSNFLINL